MASSKARGTPAFAASGFFVIRTPLLPFDEFLRWSEGLETLTSPNNPARLEETLAADRSRLRSRLHTAMTRPEVREALFVASPDLEGSFDLWVRDPESERGRGIEQALARYFLRMTGRATPFGLCAGCSVGTLGNATRLALEDRANWQRHTRLDMDYLHRLTEMLANDPKLRNVFVYRPNSSLYHAAGRLRYAESRREGKDRSYHLVAVDETDYLKATLDRAKDGASFADLAAPLVDEDITVTEAEEYIGTLIQNQILVPDIALSVTGREPIHTLIEQFSQHEATAPVAKMLARLRDELAAIDAAGLGNSPECYRAAAGLLADSPAKVELARFVQVEMIKPASKLTLDGSVLAEIVRGVELLHRLAPPRLSATDELTLFREAFTARYEQRLVPLVEVLDGEIGVGFPSRADGSDASPLLNGLDFPSAPEQTVPWQKRENVLLRKLSQVLQGGTQEMTLERQDLDEMFTPEPLPLPDAFAMLATIAAGSEDAVAAGDFRVLLTISSGPSGAVLLGRFCHADPTLHQEVERHLRAEEALRPEAVFAEIVHLPEGRIGNILARPVLRDYEIPYLGRSGVVTERQIPISDLFLTVRGERVMLFSARLGREIIPRLTSAHNFTWRSVAVYRFLCALQGQDTSWLGWDWGVLQRAPFLPRVTSGRVVLSRARWRASKEELRGLGKQHGAARFGALQTWRAERRLPRLVGLADADNELPLDLENALCVETFVERVKGRDEATLVEVFPMPDLLCASGPEGRYVHELVVPFVRKAENEGKHKGQKNISPFTIHDSRLSMPRTFPLGSEWLYAKLYTGTATADQILREVIDPLVMEVLSSGAADRWFFIRYGDPDWHVRLRFHGIPEQLHQKTLPAFEAAMAPLLHDGRIWRVQLDTYEREVERYGGPEGIVLAEQIFHADSEATLEIIENLDGSDAGLDERWRLVLRGIDMLLDDFGFDAGTKLAVLRKARTVFARELRVDSDLKAAMGDKFRKERKDLEALLAPGHDEESTLSSGFEILRHRSTRVVPVVAELKICAQAGQLTMPLTEVAPSYIHMHANRLLRSAHRAHELVLYDFLARLYDGQVARHNT
jgi:lantibiotic biosynthesis protein